MMPAQGYQQPWGMSATVRPMAEAERQAIRAIPKPQRMNAIGISLMAMLMAVMVNFVDNPVALLMPLFFSFAALGLAIQARKTSAAVAAAISRGTVTDWRCAPSLKSGVWNFGAFYFNRGGQAKGLVEEGLLTTVTIVPEAKRVLAVNGTMLSKPLELRGAPGFPQNLAAAQTVAPAQAPAWRAPAAPAQADDLPPPPDGWGAKFCPKCGEPISGDYAFCRKCGFRLKA
ncbi:MAG: zinc ribbon domain-containing protein [Thermoplasmata archaeon]